MCVILVIFLFVLYFILIMLWTNNWEKKPIGKVSWKNDTKLSYYVPLITDSKTPSVVIQCLHVYDNMNMFDYKMYYATQLDWVLFLTVTWSIIQLYHGENKLHVVAMVMMSALYLTNTLSFIVIVLAHWNNTRHNMAEILLMLALNTNQSTETTVRRLACHSNRTHY